jgi:Alr-MurF fusion protein
VNYSINDIAIITGSVWLQQEADNTVTHLLTDSRKLLFAEGSLFFAIETSTRDGHQFIERLYQQGVRNFLVSQEIDCAAYTGANFLLVPDTLAALQQLAKAHRQKFNIPVIGITGSNGKTIVKEWLNQLLEPDLQIVRSPRSYNSQLGVPLSIWLMEPLHQLGLFEAGISQNGEMQKLQQMIRPTIGLFTNLGSAHSEGFFDMEEKLREKWLLFKDADAVIYRKGHPLVDELASAYAAQNKLIFSWGFDASCLVQIKELQKKLRITTCKVLYADGEFDLSIPFTDDASVENAICCCVGLLYLGYDSSIISTRIAQLHSVAMRLELKEGINHCTIINDSYSADLSSLAIALQFLSQQQQHAKRTVILSDIPQTALTAEALYQRVAVLLHHYGVLRLLAVGAEISAAAQYFTDMGIKVEAFATTDDVVRHIDQLTFANETILIKGARSFAFEEISLLLEKQVHQTVMDINLNAMLFNLRAFQQLLSPGTKLMAMVKAFSYGSGSYEIASLLQFHGVDYLAVAYTDEGVALRKAGIHLPIMVMNATVSSFAALIDYNLEPVLYSIDLYSHFEQFIKQEAIPQYPVHLELETGMNRLGFSAVDFPVLLTLLAQQSFKIQSVFSHLAASEDARYDDFTVQQAVRFLAFCKDLEQVIPYPFIRHIENTAAILRNPGWQLNMVRLGIGLYGINSANNSQLVLEEVSSLTTTIAQIKQLLPGETVGYGRQGLITRPSSIATVRIGYADGYPRILGNGRGKMKIGHQLAPVIGSICMDMTMIDVTEITGVKEGDEVIVFGKGLPVKDLALWADTIPYEILTGISQRVKRVYYQY